jgi:CheY-like chemotaxis protein
MTGGRLNPSKARILVVDDNPQALEIMSQILLGIGASRTTKCICASDARLALSNAVFDLAIIDAEMPEQDGVELTAWIRLDPLGRNYTMPVILATGNPSSLEVRRARDGGAHYVVAKPVVPGILLDRMEWIARGSRPFVTSDTYRGPDRRFRTEPLAEGMEERRADDLRLITTPDRALSQDEISALFN